MHALVFFNKSTNDIILSRDHAGIKPLFFLESKQGLVFSSEIKGLLDISPFTKKIDRLALACTCLLGANVLRQTMFNGIYKVLPGETIVYSLDKKKIKFTFRNIVKPNSSKNYYEDEFREQVTMAIDNSALGIRNFGMFLSGGLDSSLIASGLKNKLGSLNSFTTIIETDSNQEEDYNSDGRVAKNLQNTLSFEK